MVRGPKPKNVKFEPCFHFVSRYLACLFSKICASFFAQRLSFGTILANRGVDKSAKNAQGYVPVHGTCTISTFAPQDQCVRCMQLGASPGSAHSCSARENKRALDEGAGNVIVDRFAEFTTTASRDQITLQCEELDTATRTRSGGHA